MTPKEPTPGGATPVSTSGTKDPVCGMEVDPRSAVRHEHDGKTYYFCSEHCRSKFQAEPGKYVH